MGVVLGDNRYGKAETRLVHVDRGAEAHRITDLNVTTTLAGELDATHLTGDNTGVLPTDTQKNTVYAFARDGVGEPEDFALRLARHFVDTQPTIHLARVHVESYRWEPVAATGHSFARGAGTRTATATYDGGKAWMVSGISDLTVLNTTGSQFRGFVRDRYTTLADADDRILATAVTARWRHESAEPDAWTASHARAVEHLVAAFADTPSRSLQQTLYAMGRRVLEHGPELVEVRLRLPNRHHFLVDLEPFGLDNPDAVYHAADRPYGLIEGTVLREDAPPAGEAWW
ncbi:MAG TPA: urate oxidase [Pseudonocardiaceae bacterium]|jgi:urate oxidase